MNVEMIYHTPDYHKLVETVARVCYQSYHKETDSSHSSMRGYLEKGHLSIASVGNMVFEVKNPGFGIYADLMTMYQINNFIKQTNWQRDINEVSVLKISMNMLTFLDLYKERDNFLWDSQLLNGIINEISKVPYLKWFIDKSVKLEPSVNIYSLLGTPKLYEPIVLDEDYTDLKALGLTDYELGIHATITMNFITDRSSSLQFWRHWSGGCELSQRYVERGNAEFRIPFLEDKELNEYLDTVNNQLIDSYNSILDGCEELGIRKGRAKEIARSILPNSITTQLIQSRPYKNWLHLFDLRDSTHAQKEIREDVIHIKRVLKDKGVEC